MNKPWLKGGLATGIAAALLVMSSEGLILHERPDIATGQPNICYGDTHHVTAGEVDSPEQCRARLAQQVAAAQMTVRSCIPQPPAPQIFDALTDFAYNLGPGRVGVPPKGHDGLCVLHNGHWSTIRKRAHAGNWRGVCDGFMDWTTGGGVVLQGLVTRRRNERELCLQGVPK